MCEVNHLHGQRKTGFFIIWNLIQITQVQVLRYYLHLLNRVIEFNQGVKEVQFCHIFDTWLKLMQKGDMRTHVWLFCVTDVSLPILIGWDHETFDYSYHTWMWMSNFLNTWNSKTGEEQTTSLHWAGQWEIEDCIVFLLRLTFPSSEFDWRFQTSTETTTSTQKSTTK